MYDELGIVLRQVFQQNFGRNQDEKIIFIADTITDEQKEQISPRKQAMILNREQFVKLLSIRARDLYGTENISMFSYPSTLKHGAEPPKSLIQEIQKHHIFFTLPSYSITYTEILQKSLTKDVRGASMPLATPEMFKRDSALITNSHEIEIIGNKVANTIYNIKNSDPKNECHVSIQDKFGSSLNFKILEEKLDFSKNYGKFHNGGDFGNLPAGELYTVPDHYGQVIGKLVIPQEFSKFCNPEYEYLEISFVDGRVSGLKGAKDSLEQYLGFKRGENAPLSEAIKDSRRNFALFGIGLNKNVKNLDNILLCSKKLGACHFGLGTSSIYGGEIKADLHLGFVLPYTNVFINNQKIIEQGKIIELNRA